MLCYWEKKERKKGTKHHRKTKEKQSLDIGSHSNAVHISSPDYRKTHLIAQGIGAIKMIITWCIVFFLSVVLITLVMRTWRQVSYFNFLTHFSYFLKKQLFIYYLFFSKIPISYKSFTLRVPTRLCLSSCYIYFTCGPSQTTGCSNICRYIHQI